MRTFDYTAPATVAGALVDHTDGSAYLAGGTSLVDLMKRDVARPRRLVDINALPLRGIRADAAGLRIGALELLADIARHPAVAEACPVLREALLACAPPQLRNMATLGGNLLQRTRCGYFRSTASPCNKRAPGSGCPARTGDHRGHAVLGTSPSCVAAHPSDAAVALTALDATARLRSRDGERTVPLAELHRLPGATPWIETVLRPGELLTHVTVAPLPWARRSAYVKVRDRGAGDVALVSAAVALDLAGRTVRDARVAAGGVGTRPWRLPHVEDALRGRELTPHTAAAAAARCAEGARPLPGNAFKVRLLRQTLAHALLRLGD